MAPNPSLAIPPAVDQLINRYRAKKALHRFAFTLGLAASSGSLLFVASLLIDRFWDLPDAARAAMTGVTLAVPAGLSIWAAIRFFYRDNTEHAAGELDQATPGARDLLRSAVNLTTSHPGRTQADSPVAQFMLGRALENAEAVGKTADSNGPLPWRRLPLAFAGTLVALPVLMVIFRTPMMDASLLVTRFLHPLANLPRPSLIKIAVDGPERQLIQQGDDLTIRATLSGAVPDDARATLLISNASPQPAPQRANSILMNPRPGNQFEAVLKNVAENATFTIASGDGRSERHTLAVEPRPVMSSITAQYSYPRYTLLPSRTEPVSLREFKGVEGTRVRIDFESSIAVDKSKVVFAESQVPIRWDKSGRKGSFQFTIEKDTKFSVQLTSAAGTDNRNEQPFRVRLVPDNVPTVSLLGVPEDLSLYRDDLLNLSYKGSDDFGVSEVFIRYTQSSDPRKSKDYTLKSVAGNARQVAGDFSLALRDITAPDDSWVDISLVMVDTKGQEGVSPAVRLQVISNTPDRQLIELLGFQDRFMQSLSRSANSLKTASGRLVVLLDGMDDSTAVSGARKNMLDEVARALSDVRFPLVTDDQNAKLFLVAEYPYLPQRRTEDVFSFSAALPASDVYAQSVGAALKNPTPRQDLIKLKTQVDASLPAAVALSDMLRDTMAETRWMLVSYLCSQYAGQAATAQSGGRGEASTLLAEKQEERVAAVLAQLEQLKIAEDLPALSAAAAQAKAAAAKAPSERQAALSQALAELGRQVDSGGVLDGRLGAAGETYLARNGWAEQFQQAAASERVPRAARAAASWARLRRDNFVLNNAEMFLATLLTQAAMTGDPARLAQATATAIPLRAWSQSAELDDRVQLLRSQLVSIEVDRRAGRLLPHTPALDQAWRQARELMLGIASDHKAGRFAGLAPELDAALSALVAQVPAFAAWDADIALAAAGWAQARESTLAAVAQTSRCLAPQVEAGRKKALELAARVEADLAKNIASEKQRIAAELAAIAADVEAAAKAPPGANGVMQNGRQRGRIADAARVGFAKEVSERFTSYAVTAATLTDLRLAVWSGQPSRDALPTLQAATILFEYLSHLEEDVYDKTYAQHLQQVYGVRPYPGYIEEMGRYYGGLNGPIDTLSTAFSRLSTDGGAALLADPALATIPVKINKQQRFDAQMKSVAQQLEFADAFRNAATDAARAAILVPMSRSVETPTAYWDRVYLATRDLMEQADIASQAAGTAWRGVEPAVLDAWAGRAVRLGQILPPVAESGEEVKTLRSVLEELAALRAKVVSTSVTKLDASAANSAREELVDWRGRAEGAMRALESRLTVPAMKTRPRARLMLQRTDFEQTLGRILRNENLWTERVGWAARLTASSRAMTLFADGSRATTPAELAFDFTREGSVRRRSAAVSAQVSRSLDVDQGGVDESFLKMPKYLYEELRKTLKKPYPSQFKDSELEYTQNLVKDAR